MMSRTSTIALSSDLSGTTSTQVSLQLITRITRPYRCPCMVRYLIRLSTNLSKSSITLLIVSYYRRCTESRCGHPDHAKRRMVAPFYDDERPQKLLAFCFALAFLLGLFGRGGTFCTLFLFDLFFSIHMMISKLLLITNHLITVLSYCCST